MKKVLFVKKDRGCATPEAKAEALRKVAHLEAIIDDPITGNRYKYYTMPALHDYNLCARVTIRGNRVAEVTKLPESVIDTVKPVNVPMFGGF